MLCYITHILYTTCHAMLYNTWYVMLYNTCYVMLYNTWYVMLCYITHVMLCYTTHDMLCYITHVISVLEKCQFWILCKSMFILRRKAFFLTRTSPNTISGCILHKAKRWPKPWTLQPFGKNANFVGFWNRCFRCSETLVSYIRCRKSFLHDLFSRSMTWEYRGIQGVPGGYNGLQGVTTG